MIANLRVAARGGMLICGPSRREQATRLHAAGEGESTAISGGRGFDLVPLRRRGSWVGYRAGGTVVWCGSNTP